MIRKFASVAVVAGVMLGTAGCNMITHVASAEFYAPSDGAMADAGKVAARNFLVLTDGTKSILVGSLVNSGLEGAAIQLSYPDAGTIKQAQVNLNAGQKFDLGYNGTAALPAVTEAKAGGLVEVTIKTGGSEATMSVPVLDGTLPEYKAVLDAN
jgi:hypothetical protein